MAVRHLTHAVVDDRKYVMRLTAMASAVRMLWSFTTGFIVVSHCSDDGLTAPWCRPSSLCGRPRRCLALQDVLERTGYLRRDSPPRRSLVSSSPVVFKIKKLRPGSRG